MKRLVFCVCPVVFAALNIVGFAASPEEDELGALRRRIDSYVSAFNDGNAKRLAKHWTEEAEYFHPLTQQRIRGRDQIGAAFAKFFETEKKLRLRVEVDGLRLVADDVAVEDAVATIVAPESDPEMARYVAVHVKENGQWFRASVREMVLPPAPAAPDALKSLAWMIGEWRSEDKSSPLRLRCQWSENGRFLSRSFQIGTGEPSQLAGTQIIGWDPSTERIRSWTFDSDGGFSEGVWAQQDDRWIVKATAVLPDGRTGSEQRILVPDGADRFTWRSVQRQVGERIQPGTKEVAVVRVGGRN